jgi:hypothetical protein
MDSYWDHAAERLQRVIAMLPDLDTETDSNRIQARLAEAEQSGSEELRLLLKGFDKMDGPTFSTVLATWRHKYQR